MIPDGASRPAGAAAGRAVVNTFVNTAGMSVQQASFSVDLEQIPRLIAKYEEAIGELRGVSRKARQLENIGAPGEDEVSKNLARSLGKMAGDGDGNLAWVVTKCIERLQNQIDQLKAAQSGYRTADENATPTQV